MSIVEKHKAPETVVTPPSGYSTFFVRSDTEVPAIKDSNGTVNDLFIPGDASGVTYTPENSLNWTDSVDPGQVDDALDDLALRVVTLESENDPNSFGTIAVSGQSDVAAEQSSDTLTLVAGAGMTITTDASTDTITFTPSVDASQVSFTPQYSINWTDSEDPGQVDDALDDLAARVNALEAGGGGTGGVTGPVSSTNNAAALWDGIGGDTLKDSTLLVSASDLTIGGNGVYRAGGTDVPVADGGTGVSSLTAYAVICGGTTSTGAVQSIASVGTSGQVLTSNGAGALPTFQTAAGGSLTNFTESVNTAAPNATVPVVRLLATNAATNVDVALSPKASGSLLAHVPDNASTGGNKRGTFVVDWQTDRSVATQVASGNQSVIGGGRNNTASASTSTVAGGATNTASGTESTVAGGGSNAASATRATVVGGNSNTASGVSSTVLGGFQNTADGDYSSARGRGARVRGIYGAHALSSGAVGAGADQRREFVLYAGTTDATPKAMSTDGATAASTNTVILPNASLFGFSGILSVREDATGDSKSIEFKGSIKRGANAAATALQGTVTQADLGTPDAGATWTVAFTANTTLGGLAITVTGEAAHTLRWVARLVTTEVVG